MYSGLIYFNNSRIIRGSCLVSTYQNINTPNPTQNERIQNDNSVIKASRTYTIVDESAPTKIFKKKDGNHMHAFKALTNMYLLDLNLPPYDAHDRHCCTYFIDVQDCKNCGVFPIPQPQKQPSMKDPIVLDDGIGLDTTTHVKIYSGLVELGIEYETCLMPCSAEDVGYSPAMCVYPRTCSYIA
jgi:hypothetical protein